MAAAAAASSASSSSSSASSSSSGVDENLYSRQIGVFGMEAMGKLITMKVLIVGLKGAGVETAKNLILAGPQSVTVYDPTTVEASDLGCNYYLAPEHVGAARRDEACVGKLMELNSYVRVSTLTPADKSKGLTEADLAAFNVVVFCDDGATGTSRPREELERFNEFCRTQEPAIGFIVCHLRGIAGKAFVDFGDKHVVLDEDGEQNRTATVVDIDKGEQTLVTCEDSKRHGFHEGNYVVFRDVVGMVELNDAKPAKVVDSTPYSFKVDLDSRGFGEYTVGSATVEQTKVPTIHTFSSYADRRTNPAPADAGMLITPDLGKFGRPVQLHVAFEAVDAFVAASGRMPSAHDASDAAAVVSAAKKLCADAHASGEETQLPAEADVDEDVVKAVAERACFELQPLAAFYGGVVAQEVVKLTGKFSPLRQFLYLDALEVLPEAGHALASDDFSLEGGRYDHMLGIFGRAFVDNLKSRKVFLVGSGALGCEFIKNFAMMGVGCGPGGRVTVTDMDNIEISNLNRQFLFRPEDVGKAKSVCAAAAGAAMNPDLNVEALEVAVGPDTEDQFDDTFWQSLDAVTNALDNVKARQYVDGQCVFHHRPLLESGTLGTKANAMAIAPFLTESYSDSQDPEEESIPMCTLKNFPHAIEHCIEWARDLFQGSFTASLQEAATFRDGPEDWIAKTLAEPNAYTRRQRLEGVQAAVEMSGHADWDRCVQEAARMFHRHFYLNICQLLHNFPKDYVNKETGIPFWSGHKRAPAPIALDVDDPTHRDFLVHTAALIAYNFGLSVPADAGSTESLRANVEAADLPPFVPKNVTIKAGEDDDAVEGADDDDVVARDIAEKLRALASSTDLASLKLFPADFEKDDDSNHHIDFITAVSNLRAGNYRITTVPRHRVKIIAGKIIPAIATTTCAVTGLVGIEFLKTLFAPKIEVYRSSFFNLAINLYSMAEPLPAKKTKSKKYDPVTMGPVRAQPEDFTPWDRVSLKGTKATTVGEVRDMIASTQKVDVDIISINIGGETKMLFAPLFAPSHAAREPRPVLDVVHEMGLKLPKSRNYLVLDVGCSDSDGDVVIPRVVFTFE